ncbi:MAG: metallophosphoesterase [Clostridiales bacterium]|nr:metallophosphoesterase [Clostridiales bacterium]
MKITFIADTHYYSKKLGTSGKAYELRAGSDQKCLAETEEIIDSAFEKIANSGTDAVFILGDLTNNGEMVSHIEFREKLYKLKKKKPVYVITATHDWCCDKNPRRFFEDTVYNDVKVMKSADLPRFYADFGPLQAIDAFITEIGTVCYTVQFSCSVRVLCLNDDKNENDHAGYTPECWNWIERQIENAKADKCVLIGIQHHLLIPHISPVITGGSTCVENREYVASRFADLGLKYMLVGHSHIQATDKFVSKAGNSITEINVGSLCGYPAPMVNVTVNDNGSLSYKVDCLEKFSLNGKEINAGDFLAKHALDLIFRVIECKNKREFSERLTALGFNGNKIAEFWLLFKPLLNKLNTALVWDVYKRLKLLGAARGISYSQARRYRYKPLKDMIGEIYLSALDGAKHKHGRESTYYKLVMAAVSVLSLFAKGSKNSAELKKAADYILTGGEINNQSALI